MTAKHRQEQLFTAKVTFTGPVCFENGVTFIGGAFSPYFVTTIAAGKFVAFPTAGETIADNTNLNHVGKVIGISLGEGLGVGFSGTVKNPSWSFLPGAGLFLNSSGDPSLVVPSTGFQLQVGVASGIDEIALGLGTAIILA